MGILIFVLYIFFSCTGMLLIKMGAENFHVGMTDLRITAGFDIFFCIGAVFYIISFMLWVLLFQRLNLSYIAPLATGVSNIVILALAVFFLREKLNLYQYIGVGTIILGVFLLNMKN